MKTLVLIDGHSLAYRMHFALEHTAMRTSNKVPTWAVYGFFNALFSLLKKTRPDAMAVSFDVGRVTFRTEQYADYKAHRASMPDDLREQMSLIRQGVECLGIPIYQLEGYEADDVIGTLARQASEKGCYVQILTGDQDAFQLICAEGEQCPGKVEVLIPPRSPREEAKAYDAQAVFDKLGVYPEQVTDFKGLKGDTSDNIPGVPGVGDKTAAKLLAEYGTLENLYDHIEDLPKNKLYERLITYRDQAVLSKSLATICREAPVTVDLEHCNLEIHDYPALLAFFEACEFRTFVKQAQSLLAPFLQGQALPNVPVIDTNAPAMPETQGLLPGLQGVNEVEGLLEVATVTTQVALLEKAAAPAAVAHTVVTDSAQLEALVRRLEASRVFSLDLETNGLDVLSCEIVGVAISVCDAFVPTTRPAVNILGLSDYPQTFQALSLGHLEQPLADDVIETYYIPVGHADLMTPQLAREQVLLALAPLLTSSEVAKIVHNAKFELNMFEVAGTPLRGLVFDTMLASYIINPDRRHGLKSLGYEIFNFKMREIKELIGTGKNQRTFDQVPITDAAPYAAADAFMTLKLADHFLRQMDEDQRTLFYEVEMPLAFVLADMERIGIALDTAYLKTLSDDLGQKLAVLEKEICRLADCRFNLNSPKQVGEVLFDKLGIPPSKKTKGKTGYSTDVKVLEQLADEHEVVRKLLEYRQLFKLKSTYIDALPALINPKTGRVHTSFNQAVTATGRLSSSNPNLQNIPIRSELGRSIRKAFVPGHRPGWSLLSADYSQIELRLLAHFSEDPNLVEAFRNGEDVHTATAALVFGMPKDKVTKEQRYRAKTVNFGVIYGQSAYGLSQQLKIPAGEAAEFIQRYFNRYGNVRQFIEDTKAEAHETGQVKTICGRARDLSEGLNSANRNIREFSERAAFNTPLQGSAADLMKVAMIRLCRRLKREELRTNILLQVHDELVLEVPDEERTYVEELVLWAMGLDQPLRVPLVVDVHTGPTWMES